MSEHVEGRVRARDVGSPGSPAPRAGTVAVGGTDRAGGLRLRDTRALPRARSRGPARARARGARVTPPGPQPADPHRGPAVPELRARAAVRLGPPHPDRPPVVELEGA